MPAFTVNRGYPYSLPTDPADVPQALEDLANAIDNDVCALTNGVTGRPAARFRGTGTFGSITPQFPVFAMPQPSTARVPFDTTDFNTANVVLQSQEIGNRLIFPDDPGFYFALATIYVPVLTASTNVDYLRLSMHKADATVPNSPVAGPRLGGTSNNVLVENHDRNVRVMSLGVGTFMNGTTDAFSVEFVADTVPDISEYEIGERTITIIKMTQS